MKRIALIFALFAPVAFSQAVRVDIPIQTTGPNVPTTGGALPQALWVANATVALCAHPTASLAACQAAPLTTYTDSTQGTTCPAATPLVQLPGNTCTAATGAAATLGFWYAGGLFDYWVTSAWGSYGPFTGSSGGGGSNGIHTWSFAMPSPMTSAYSFIVPVTTSTMSFLACSGSSCIGVSGYPAVVSTTLILKKNGSTFCTATFAPAATTATFSCASPTTFAQGDLLQVIYSGDAGLVPSVSLTVVN